MHSEYCRPGLGPGGTTDYLVTLGRCADTSEMSMPSLVTGGVRLPLSEGVDGADGTKRGPRRELAGASMQHKAVVAATAAAW